MSYDRAIYKKAIWLKPTFIESAQYHGRKFEPKSPTPSIDLLRDRVSLLLHANVKKMRTWLRYCHEYPISLRLKAAIEAVESLIGNVDKLCVDDLLVMMLKAIIDQKFYNYDDANDLFHDRKFIINVNRMGCAVVGDSLLVNGKVWDVQSYISDPVNDPHTGGRVGTWDLRKFAKKNPDVEWAKLI